MNNESPAPKDKGVKLSETAKEIVMKVLRWEPISRYQFPTAKEQQRFIDDWNHLALSFIELFSDHEAALKSKEEEIFKMLDRAYMIGQGVSQSGKYYSKEEFLKMCKEGFK